MKGIEQALKKLKDHQLIDPNAAVTFVEIPKSAPAPLRLFDISIKGNGDRYVDNPQAGNYYLLSESEGFVCTTDAIRNH